MTAVPRGTAVTASKKSSPKIAFADFVWHFTVGKPWDSTTIIAKKTLFGVHAQVSYIYMYIHIYIYIYIAKISTVLWVYVFFVFGKSISPGSEPT